ncbi:HNH endonuclease signature motif containing protein [Demequina sp.]|uniref:HNH endonuclease n=1 Tax=Demequina sp. TaxID=2050685 RepID=UPI0025E6520A|nr:HNH endonuclease signature motif containing protein [Demequina sp.]
MDIPRLFDSESGGGTTAVAGFGRACSQARSAVGTMRDLAAAADVQATGQRELLERIEAAAMLAREVDLVLARVSREVERRSDEVPAGGLARRQGHRSAADLVAAAMGATRAEAMRLLAVGRALEEASAAASPDVSDGDGTPDSESHNALDDVPEGGPDLSPRTVEAEPGPESPPPPPRPAPRYPYVTAALDRGEISVECGTLIMSMLDSLSESVDVERRRTAERDLVSRAPGMAAGQFARIVRRFKAALDVAENDRQVARMRQERTLRLYEDRQGMLVLQGRFDPETGAPLRAALDALVGDAMRRSREAVGEDTRTTDQMRADSLASLARHALGCSATDLPLSTVTVVVRVEEKDLQRGLGLAEVDGCTQPIDISTLRRMAADADVVPAVLGGRSELLDFGRRRRLFTRAQRLALGERDGGCAFCGAPPAWTEVHHIRWWSRDRGRTNVANGVLLCSHCHHVIHDQNWEIETTATEVWFRPPASVDPSRARRLGGRARFYPPSESPPSESPPGESPPGASSPATEPAAAPAA